MLAAILVLDQFPRNMFRRDARCFVTDAPALALAKRAIAEGLDAKLRPEQRMFLYMPFQHAEDKDDQARAVALFTMLGNPLGLDFALRHQAIFDRFGRFPHRNANFHTERYARAAVDGGGAGLPGHARLVLLSPISRARRRAGRGER